MSEVTIKMTQAAIKQLVADGILPKHAPEEIYLKHWDSVKKAIEKAMELQHAPDY